MTGQDRTAPPADLVLKIRAKRANAVVAKMTPEQEAEQKALMDELWRKDQERWEKRQAEAQTPESSETT